MRIALDTNRFTELLRVNSQPIPEISSRSFAGQRATLDSISSA